MFEPTHSVEEQSALTAPIVKAWPSALDPHRQWVAAGAKTTAKASRRIKQVMTADWRPGARSDGSGRFRASMFSDECDRKQVLSYNGEVSAPMDYTGWALTSAGTYGHYRWQHAGLSAGWLLDVEVHVPGVGSMDGLMSDGVTGFELKTTNYKTFQKVSDIAQACQRGLTGAELAALAKGTPVEGHLEQMHLYMIGSRRDLDLPDLEGFVIVYEERGWMEAKEIYVPYDQDRADRIMDKMSRLYSYVAQGVVPQMHDECMAGDSQRFARCGYSEACVRHPAR